MMIQCWFSDDNVYNLSRSDEKNEMFYEIAVLSAEWFSFRKLPFFLSNFFVMKFTSLDTKTGIVGW